MGRFSSDKVRKRVVYLVCPSLFAFLEVRRQNKYCLCEIHLFSYEHIFGLMRQSRNCEKQQFEDVGCVFTYFCDGHKNNFGL